MRLNNQPGSKVLKTHGEAQPVSSPNEHLKGALHWRRHVLGRSAAPRDSLGSAAMGWAVSSAASPALNIGRIARGRADHDTKTFFQDDRPECHHKEMNHERHRVEGRPGDKVRNGSHEVEGESGRC